MSAWQSSLKAAMSHLDQSGMIRSLKVRESPNAPVVTLNGQEKLAFCSNDYLGLSYHPEIIAALQEGTKLYGTGSGASSLISGHTSIHAQLEFRLAKTQSLHIPNAGASYISTGFMANIAVITALATLGNISIYSDALNHASIIDAIRLAKASSQATCFVYQHANYEELHQLLTMDPNPLKLIVSDGVFSMDGDIVDLPQLLAISKEFDALLYIDDAHGFGVLGNSGHGILEHFNIEANNLIYMGTLGKSAGIAGAFVVAEQAWIDWLIQKARAIIYSTAPPPNLAFALLKSIDLITGDVGALRRKQLNSLIEYWTTHATFNKWQAIPSPTAIQPLIIGSNLDVLKVSEELSKANLWVPAIRPPTVPVNTGRLRIALNALHETTHLEMLIDRLKAIQ
jgi:8-amino-7-oxononanoate synthase